MKVSVIVPVYNTEAYLKKCIDSILSQSFTDIEIILIDDGSEDGCPEICDYYGMHDKRVIVLHKKNNGPSSARNDGIMAAAGEYILFVDADDYIEHDAVENLYQRANTDKLDILIGRFVFNDDFVKISYTEDDVYKKIWKSEDFLFYKLKKGFRSMVIWTGMYKRQFIIDNKLFFKEGLVHEDELWLPTVYLSSGMLGLIKFPFYHYNIANTNSITKRMDQSKNGEDYLEICRLLEKLYNGIEDCNLRTMAMDSLAQLYIYAVVRCRLFKGEILKSDYIKFLRGKAFLGKTKLKVFIFSISRRASYFLYFIKKKFVFERRFVNSQKRK